jgi:glycerophosphoryl diester phosphodiesterase
VTGPDAFPLAGPAEIIAHRGFSARAPENTLVALALGLQAGADAVEFDLHPTRDGEPVLLHDPTLDRTTDRSGPIADRTLAELEGTDAGSWFAPAYAGEPLPSLADALGQLAPTSTRIYAEVKRSERRADLERVVELAAEANAMDRTVFISMDWDALDTIRALDPEARIGYIVERPSRTVAALARAQGDAAALVDFDARILLRDPGVAERAVGMGVPLATWTVNMPGDAERLLRMGVPRITTNQVARLVAWRDAL